MSPLARRAKAQASVPATADLLILPPLPGARDEDIIGLCGVPGRLPGVARLPGEPLACMVRRALCLIEGSGPVVVALTYK
jgi:hypothetical protein